MKYYGIMPKRTILTKVIIIIFSVYLIYNSSINFNIFYLLIGIILILATFSNRKHIISQEGVDILYTVCGIKFHNIWSWDDINTLHTDSMNSKPNIELHIGKNIVSRRFIFTKFESDEILKLARKINSKIYISEINRK